jgi:glycosyltransferase involved in cell wall biosynthesis
VSIHNGNFIQKHAEAVALQSEVAALFVCSDPACKTMYEVEQQVINNVFTVNVYYKKVNHKMPLLSQGQRAWRYLHAHFIGYRIAKKKLGGIDMVHHNILYPAGVFAWLLKTLHGYSYIITEHSTEYLPTNRKKFNWIRKTANHFITGKAACITVVSENLKKAMINRGIKADYKIVYNVVNTDLFIPDQNKENKTAETKFKLIHISTLKDEQKNISGMLRTIARLSQQRHDFECWLIGEGDQNPHITLAKELGIYQSTTFFDGIKNTEDIAKIMKSADCLFMFSNYENLPVVIVEALACGVPVLSSDVGGIAEHIHEDNGLLVPAGDEEALLKAFNKMLDNLKENKYNREALRDYAVKNFSYVEVGKKFHHIYSEILHAV